MKDNFNFKKYIDNNPLLQEEGSMYSQLAGNVTDETLGELINAIRKATEEGITHSAIMNLVDQLGPKPLPDSPNPWDTVNEASEFTIKAGDDDYRYDPKAPRDWYEGPFDVVVVKHENGVRLIQKVGGRPQIVVLSQNQAQELKDSL